MNKRLIVDDRLRERELGDPETLNAEFWKRQYEDHNYKNVDGFGLTMQFLMPGFSQITLGTWSGNWLIVSAVLGNIPVTESD